MTASNTPTVKIDEVDVQVLSLVHMSGLKPRTQPIIERFEKLQQMGYLKRNHSKNMTYSRLTDEGKAALDAYLAAKHN
jgi:hypothetical protein